MTTIKEYIESKSPIHCELSTLFDRRSTMTIFDVGACEGEDSIRYAKMFPQAEIHCFEPIAKNYQKVLDNIKQFGMKNIHPHPFALSRETGKSTFYVSSGRPPNAPDNNWDYGNKSSSLLAPDKVKEFHSWLNFDDSVTVDTVKLEDFCLKQGIEKIDFLHMDVQGAELMVLDGAGDFLKKIQTIWLEVEAVSLYENQPLKNDIENYLTGHGFKRLFSTVDKLAGDQLYANKIYYSPWWIYLHFYPGKFLKRLQNLFNPNAV